MTNTHRALVSLAYLGVAAAWGKAPAPPPPDQTVEIAVGVLVTVVAAVGLFILLMKRPKGPVTCSLVFCPTDENVFARWHATGAAATTKEEERVLARFVPTVPVSQHKVKHNCGRNELGSHHVAAGNNKTFFSGWVQYVSLAAKTGRASVQILEDVPGRPVLVAAVTSDSKVLRCRAGATLHLGEAVGVAVVPGGSEDFDMTYIEPDQLKLIGNLHGVAEALGEVGANSPKNSLARRSSRADMPHVHTK